jgi:anaerobic selenocysteine-containing dehydrogenase
MEGDEVVQEDVASYCRICAAACGIVVTVERAHDGDRVAERVVAVRGDDAHPLSRGYTCPKGRALAAWHHGPDRLDHPELRGARAGWDDTLDDLAATLEMVAERHGRDAVGVYVATGIAYDSGGQIGLGGLLGTLRTGSFYSAATLDNAPVLLAAAMVTGSSAAAPVWDPDAAGVLLLVGTNPVVSHGYGTTLPDPVRHLRDHRRAGGRVWVLDPRRTETAAQADGHLALQPGSDVVVLAAIARALLDDPACRARLERDAVEGDAARVRAALSRFGLSEAARAAGVDEDLLAGLVADVRAAPGRLAVLCGTGTTMARDGILVEWLRWVLLVAAGSLDVDGGMRFRPGPFGRPARGRPWTPTPAGPVSRPDLPRVVGQLPSVAIADEIAAGNLRALVVLGGNPATACPDPAYATAQLARLEALAVVDVARTQTVELATHVLPGTGQLERADVDMNGYLSLAPGVRATRPVVGASAERRPMWWILAALAARLGGDLLGGLAPDAALGVITDEQFLGGALAAVGHDAGEVFSHGARHVDRDDPVGWFREEVLPDGRFALAHDVLLDRLAAHVLPADQLVLTPRREMAWSNSVRYSTTAGEAGGSTPEVRAHPDDLLAAGVAPGHAARLSTRHGAITVTTRADPMVRPGTVSVTHARATANASALVGAREDVDPLSAMPWMSGVPVDLRAVTSEP